MASCSLSTYIKLQPSTLSDRLPHRCHDHEVYSDRVQSNFFHCISPCSSLLFQNHLDARSSPSSVCFFDSRPLDQDSPNIFDSPLSSLHPTADESLPLKGCSSTTFDQSLQNVQFFEELEFDSSLLHHKNDRNCHTFSGSSHSKPFDLRSQLSYCVPFGIDVVPGDLAIETLLSNGAEEVSSIPFESNQQQGPHVATDVNKIVSHFRKTVDGKRARLSDFTEVLFDERLAESNTGICPTFSLPMLDVDQILPLSEDLCAPLSCSGRSKISKLQHEVMNTWFYSHLNHP